MCEADSYSMRTLSESVNYTDDPFAFANSLDLGHFPEEIIKAFPKEPLEFTDQEWKIVKGSTDL